MSANQYTVEDEGSAFDEALNGSAQAAAATVKPPKKSPEQKKQERVAEKLIEKAADAPSKEDTMKHQKLLLQLTRWGAHERFSSYLKDHGFELTASKLRDKRITELEELLERVKVTIASKHQSKFISTIALGGVGIVENVTTRIPRIREKFDITGTSLALAQNEQFMDLLAQLEMEYSSVSTLSPEKMLLLTVGQTMMMANQTNQASKMLKAQLAAAAQAAQAPEASSFSETNGASQEPEDEPEPTSSAQSAESVSASTRSRLGFDPSICAGSGNSA